MKTERTTPEQRAEMVATFRQSGLSQRAFAELEGINLSRLQSWLYAKSSRVKSAPQPRFVRVTTPAMTPMGGEIQLRIGETVSLQLANLPEPEYVARLHRALSAC
jgi:hypothetical protein